MVILSIVLEADKEMGGLFGCWTGRAVRNKENERNVSGDKDNGLI
jgi:hypothetical protein